MFLQNWIKSDETIKYGWRKTIIIGIFVEFYLKVLSAKTTELVSAYQEVFLLKKT